jgi:hypothetical protein
MAVLDLKDIDSEIVGPRASYVMQQLADAGIPPDFNTYAALIYIIMCQLKSQARVPEGEARPLDVIICISRIMGVASLMVGWDGDDSTATHTYAIAKKN